VVLFLCFVERGSGGGVVGDKEVGGGKKEVCWGDNGCSAREMRRMVGVAVR